MARRVAASLIGLLFITGCTQNPTPAVVVPTIESVLALQWTLLLTHSNMEVFNAVPSALLGPYIAQYLAHSNQIPYQSARSGVEAQMAVLFGSPDQSDEALEILSGLGSALEVNLPDLLNRSTDRTKTLNEYINALQKLLILSTNQQKALVDKGSALARTHTEQRKVSATLQHELNQALLQKNYSAASEKQSEQTKAEADLAVTVGKQRENRNRIDMFKNLINIGTQRLSAIQQNRSALIAGVNVIDVPGIEQIGILNTTRSRSRSVSSSIFDPGGFGG